MQDGKQWLVTGKIFLLSSPPAPFNLEHRIPQQQLDILWGWHDTSLQPKLSLVPIQFARQFQNEMVGEQSFICFYMEVEFCSEND